MKINFAGAFFDSSGYAQFARSWAVAMHRAGWDLCLEPIFFEKVQADHGEYGAICKKISDKGVKSSDINIINMVPRLYSNLKKKNMINIGYTMFETSKIPQSWVEECNKMDAIIVPCNWNKEVFQNSGVNVPVIVVTPGIDPELYPIQKKEIVQKEKYKFYSVFQWSERKNPAALIRAFVSAFSGNTSVSLTIKTYIKDYSKEEADKLRAEIISIRDSIDTKSYPQIILKHDKLSDKQMQDLHHSHDCFVLPTRAEGLGLPYLESMMAGNPTIGTRYSGNLEFMNDSNSYLIDYQLEPVFNMKHLSGWYTGDMRWAQPNVSQLADKMQEIYADQEKAMALSATARDDLLSRFSWEKQLKQMKDALTQIASNKQ